MSSLCKAFLDRCMVFRQQNFALSGKVGAVGAGRNGGQELTLQSVQAALMSQNLIIVGDGRPTSHFGAALMNTKDDISGDEFGVNTAKNLGRHVAEVALRLAGMQGTIKPKSLMANAMDCMAVRRSDPFRSWPVVKLPINRMALLASQTEEPSERTSESRTRQIRFGKSAIAK